MTSNSRSPRRRSLSRGQKARLVAGQAPKGALNLTPFFKWSVVILVFFVVSWAFVERESLLGLAQGSDEPQTEVCTVTKVNQTREFMTDCGRYLWGEELGTPSPYGTLVVGERYNLTATGTRFTLFGFKPTLTSFTPAI